MILWAPSPLGGGGPPPPIFNLKCQRKHDYSMRMIAEKGAIADALLNKYKTVCSHPEDGLRSLQGIKPPFMHASAIPVMSTPTIYIFTELSERPFEQLSGETVKVASQKNDEDDDDDLVLMDADISMDCLDDEKSSKAGTH